MGGGDNDYNDTSKNENLQMKKEILGFKSIPGEQYQSTIVCSNCPYCPHVGETKTTTSWSVKSCICCWYCGGYWTCWQLLKGKDFIPKDCLHKCGGCGKELKQYKSCDVDVEVKDNEEPKK